MSDAEIREIVKTYICSATFGQEDRLRALLHPNFQTAGQIGDAEHWFDRDAAIASCIRNAQPPEAPMPIWSIKSMTIFAQSAAVVVESRYNEALFTEILTFLLCAGDWRLAFKSFEISA